MTLANKFVNPKEKRYFFMVALIAIVLHIILTVITFGMYLPYYFLLFFFINGCCLGEIRYHGVKVSSNQFPDVYSSVIRISKKMELDLPNVYIFQAGGLLNAFAFKFFQSKCIIIYSDILELAYKEGNDALDFVIAHELAHLKRNHIDKSIWFFPGLIIPFLGQAYYRACEYSCDRIAREHTDLPGALKGLAVLALGKTLYTKLNKEDYILQASLERGFWTWLVEKFSSHPPLWKRIIAIEH